ncbi:unnamed protein product [Knipowitschia caucasica]|uniref:Uncharacterized protein n=1 Tax=Knipowitschia caucasica TaxID=637954 RepID=A0AAV2J6S2_KNICA
MDYNQSFSALNERLRPRIDIGSPIYNSLNRLEDRTPRATSPYYTRSTILPTNPTPAKDLTPEQDELDHGFASDPPQIFEDNATLLSEMGMSEAGEEDDASSTKSEEKDCPGELLTERAAGGSEGPGAPEESIVHKAFMDGTLPDLIKSGRPLGRRNTLGHVNDTLKEVRREVELSRRRSIRLKAQVDKLQESHQGHGWSQDRERVTEEVLSILRLLHPLTESGPLEIPAGRNRLDAGLNQLQFVSRKLALDHTSQDKSKSGNVEETTILQQALRDRDEAMEKKKAMETELLRSKTEMMALNNQLLEAVQKRLELSLELEAWKEDVQLMIQQQVQAQQQAEQSTKKTFRTIMRRNNKPPLQRPNIFSVSTPPAPPPTNSSSHIYVNKPSPSSTAPSANTGTLPRNWRLKKKAVRPEPEGMDGFQVVSLD